MLYLTFLGKAKIMVFNTLLRQECQKIFSTGKKSVRTAVTACHKGLPVKIFIVLLHVQSATECYNKGPHFCS